MTKGDFPHTHREFVQEFPDDDACAAYLERLRWPEGFCCPACQTVGMPCRQTRGRLFCMSPPDIRDDWNNPGEDADTPYDLV